MRLNLIFIYGLFIYHGVHFVVHKDAVTCIMSRAKVLISYDKLGTSRMRTTTVDHIHIAEERSERARREMSVDSVLGSPDSCQSTTFVW
jgi:hypothetical protein